MWPWGLVTILQALCVQVKDVYVTILCTINSSHVYVR